MTGLLDIIVFQGISAWFLVALTFFGVLAIPRFFGLNIFHGLLYSSCTLLFNSFSIIAGLDSGLIGMDRGLHFYIVEFSFFMLTVALYSHLLNHRALVLSGINVFFKSGGGLWVVVFTFGMVIFNFLLVPTDGSSRIAYMAEAWFSLIKPFIQVAIPLAYVGVFIMLQDPRHRYLGYLLFLAVVLSNIATGSKASFVFGLLSSFLMLRDISAPARFAMRRWDLFIVLAFGCVAVVAALDRLDVSMKDIADRFFLFGEATILTYFSDVPTAACSGLSTFASMHRGLARLFGDVGAENIDTLFGYALTIENLGVNTFTGPNGRLSAYALCNFPDARIVFGVVVVTIYFGLMLLLFRRLLKRPRFMALIFPFLIGSLTGAAQDFNLIMQDITILIALTLVTFIVYFRPTRLQHE